MRDFMGSHVSQVDEYGRQKDVDDVFVSARVLGSFVVRYAENVDKVVVEVEPQIGGGVMMQLTLDQATLLRELLDAGIADMRAAKIVELPAAAGGDAA
ncbi:hypothetical protein C5E51_16800 [Nocardia nova]|uniref:hypothetical protein n=1 Tax=Nocardia nova TaxID=37330 RepID=UPI000CE9E439|nr:hypothetical protein [Nocardia nova]PPJ07833.1 hypothetical protein C5E51_16800 [Nocardia nova]